jgi:ParB family chromosome partitioning protein
VKVELGRRKGKIVVEFASLQDLERIISAMSPEWAQNLSA